MSSFTVYNMYCDFAIFQIDVNWLLVLVIIIMFSCNIFSN